MGVEGDGEVGRVGQAKTGRGSVENQVLGRFLKFTRQFQALTFAARQRVESLPERDVPESHVFQRLQRRENRFLRKVRQRVRDGEVQHFVDVLPSKCQRKNRIGETASLTGLTAHGDGIEVLQIRVDDTQTFARGACSLGVRAEERWLNLVGGRKRFPNCV